MFKEQYYQFTLLFEGLNLHPKTKKPLMTKGVYTVEGVYVGASFHVRKRIKQHILSVKKNPSFFTNELQFFLLKRINESNPEIRICVLSENLLEEERYTKIFKCKTNRFAKWHNGLRRK